LRRPAFPAVCLQRNGRSCGQDSSATEAVGFLLSCAPPKSIQPRELNMAKYYKKGLPPVESEAANLKVQETVREILADVRQRGDAAVRELSERFDGWSPPDFRLSPGEIDSLVASVSRQTIEDIKFA